MSKLTAEDVKSIIEERKTKTIFELAAKYGVHFSHISLICRGKRRKEATSRKYYKTCRPYPLTDDQIDELLRLSYTTPFPELSKRFGAAFGVLNRICFDLLGKKFTKSKIPPATLDKIVELSQNQGNYSIAKLFGLSATYVGRIVNGKIRTRDLSENSKKIIRERTRKGRFQQKITPEIRANLLDDYKNHMKPPKIAKKYGISSTYVYYILNKYAVPTD
jgi:transcriptional regulator with XRE-family HTH domain